jgi:hypothetical protein
MEHTKLMSGLITITFWSVFLASDLATAIVVVSLGVLANGVVEITEKRSV